MSRRPRIDRALPAIVLLFVGSGCAALVYEVVWFQLLQIVIGSSAVSLGVLLGTFMGGMCLGSLLLPRLVDRRRHPLRVYAVLELAIAAIGLLLMMGVPLVGDVYGKLRRAHRGPHGDCLRLSPAADDGDGRDAAGDGALGRNVAGRRGMAGILLWQQHRGRGRGNTARGVLSPAGLRCRRGDVPVAAAMNLAVAGAAWAIAGRTPSAAVDSAGPPAAGRAEDSALVYVTIALSGMTALSAEVIWTRLLSLHFGATVYTFSLILAAVLVGIGAGSGLGALVERRPGVRPRVALGWCQILLCAAIAWAAYLLTHALPYWPVAEAVRGDPWLTFRLDLFRSLIVVLPGAILWGASFPLALASVATLGQDPGRLVGGVYAANTLGAIAGSLGTSLLLAGVLGSQHVQQMLIGISAVSGVTAWMPASRRQRRAECGPRIGWPPPRRSQFLSRVSRRCPACSSPTAGSRRNGPRRAGMRTPAASSTPAKG